MLRGPVKVPDFRRFALGRAEQWNTARHTQVATGDEETGDPGAHASPGGT